MSNTDIWFDKLEKVIEFMTNNNGKRPSRGTSLSSWLNDQMKFYRDVTFKGKECGAGMWVNEERKKAWSEFMHKFEDSLLSKEEIWDKKLYLLDQYIALHNSNPSENGTDDEVALLRWSYDQVKRVKPGTDRYVKWQQLCQKYPEHFQSYEAGWNESYDEIVAFVQKYGQKPSQDGADDDECRLSRWMTRQNMSLSRGELAEDRVMKWEWFCMEYGDLQSSSVAKTSAARELCSRAVAVGPEVLNLEVSPRELCSRAVAVGPEVLNPEVLSREPNGSRAAFPPKESGSNVNTTRVGAAAGAAVSKSTGWEKSSGLTPAVQCLLNKHKKCKGKDRNGDPCRNYTDNGELYCKRSHAYMAEYTDEQIEEFKLCGCCKKWITIPDNRTQCDVCNKRGKDNREKARAAVVLCKSDGCTFKKSEENDYCGKHQICVFVDSCRDEGVRPCRRYLHGCRVKLAPNYGFTACYECLEIERLQENARRRQVVPDNIVEEMKQCTVCTKWKPISDYQNKNNSSVTLTCLSCRDDFAVANSRRDMEHIREIQRIASKKPERKAVKKTWEENNYDKVALKTLTYRDKQHATNQEEYLKRNAKTMAKWRDNNPEKVQELNKSRVENIKYAYKTYVTKCELREIKMELTQEIFEKLVLQPCYYCGIIQTKGFNGVDRMDSTRGYELDNCVSCCDECNTMKGAIDNVTFIKRAEHILTHNGIINGHLHPRAFANHKSCNHNAYTKSAQVRGYYFELSEDEFNQIITKDCYICGKPNSSRHTNGIDRYDNNIGYTVANCRPCCGQCNIMKNELSYDYLLQKLLVIYNNSKNKEFTLVSKPIINALNRSLNKPTKAEMQIKAKERKQRNRDAKRLATGNIEYLQKRAKQMAEYRKQKKEAVKNVENTPKSDDYSTDDEGL